MDQWSIGIAEIKQSQQTLDENKMSAKFLCAAALCLAIIVGQTEALESKSSKLLGSRSQQASQQQQQSTSIDRHDDGASKSGSFSPRMLDQLEQPKEQSRFQSSDAWQSHNSMPTYADREQGDEMIALASAMDAVGMDSMGVRIMMPNESMPSKANKPLNRPLESDSAPRSQQKPQASKTNFPIDLLNDEYYQDGDDEDSDPEELGPLNAGRGSTKPQAAHEVERKQARQPKVAPEEIAIQRLAPIHEPASQTNKTNKLPNKQVPFEPVWFQQRNDTGDTGELQASSKNRAQNTNPIQANKISSLLSSRESLSTLNRADAAIEYLKNMLKGKQQSKNNATDDLATQRLRQHIDSSTGASPKSKLNLQRLSSIASRINQLLSNGADSQPIVNNTMPVDKPTEPKPLESMGPVEGTKFSIQDAKTSDDRDTQASNQKLASAGQFQPMETRAEPANQKTGTPLGGDYIESLDEFPRPGFSPAKASHSSGEFESSIDNQPAKQADKNDNQYQNPLIGGQNNSDRPKKDQTSNEKQQQHQQVYPMADLPTFEDKGPNRYHNFDMAVDSSNHSPSTHSSLMGLLKSPQAHYQQLESAGNQNQNQNHSYLDAKPQKPIEFRVTESTEIPVPSIQEPTKSNNHHQSIASISQPSQPVATSSQPIKVGGPTKLSPPPTANQVSYLEPSISDLIQKLESHKIQVPKSSNLEQPRKSSPSLQQPKIIQYDYSEQSNMPNRPSQPSVQDFVGGPREELADLVATNYQLADALYSSSGNLEQMLSATELEAIKRQILLSANSDPIQGFGPQQPTLASSRFPTELAYPSRSISGSGSSLMSQNLPHSMGLGYQNHRALGEGLQPIQNMAASISGNQLMTNKLTSSPSKQAEELLSELASERESLFALAPSRSLERQPKLLDPSVTVKQKPSSADARDPSQQSNDNKKKKNLIVYLNHPKSNEMQKGAQEASSSGSGSGLHEQPQSDEFVSAKEFDSLGLSKESKLLDIAKLSSSGPMDPSLGIESVPGDKDGLSVVVIGDAYKYKKIILLISAKSGGLKFVPMVKDEKWNKVV